MCEANVYLKNGDHEELFMESVDIIEPHGEGLKLVDIFGTQKFLMAKIKDMTLLNHRIILESVDNSSN
ncbi:MAG: CooT family nickel-binding protein [Desulfitobacterium hafniense]|nr:CooT family nickel-binding protein [Desulfitobacterium hafniense]